MHMAPKILIACLVHQLEIPVSVVVGARPVGSEVPKERPRNYVVLISVAGLNKLSASSYVDAASVLIPLGRDPQRFSLVVGPLYCHWAMLSVAREPARRLSEP